MLTAVINNLTESGASNMHEEQDPTGAFQLWSCYSFGHSYMHKFQLWAIWPGYPNWESVTLSFHIQQHIKTFWTAENDMNLWLIITVI